MRFKIPYQTNRDKEFYISEIQSNISMFLFLLDYELCQHFKIEEIEALSEEERIDLDIRFYKNHFVIKTKGKKEKTRVGKLKQESEYGFYNICSSIADFVMCNEWGDIQDLGGE